MNNPPGNNPAGMPDRAGQPDSEKVITEMYSLEFIGNLLGNADCLIVCEIKLSRIWRAGLHRPNCWKNTQQWNVT